MAGEGLSVDKLPTAFGPMSMTARQQGNSLAVTLAPGIREDAAMRVAWPSRTRPTSVMVDGRPVTDYDAGGIALARPFRTLVAQW